MRKKAGKEVFENVVKSIGCMPPTVKMISKVRSNGTVRRIGEFEVDQRGREGEKTR